MASSAATALAEHGTSPGTLPWERSLKDALRKARAQHRPLLVGFWAGWCHWCHELDATTYRDPAVVRSAAAFIPVKIDTEGSLAEKQASADYGVETLPTVGFLSPEGRPILFVENFEGAEEFARTLERAGLAAARVLEWEDALARDGDDPAALAGLGTHLVEQKRSDEGRRLLERAITRDAGRPAVERKRTRILLATIRRGTKRSGEAEKLLQAVLALRPADPLENAEALAEDAEALFELGEIYRDKGRIQAARDAWRRVLDEAPQAPASAKARQALEATRSS
jgi:thioredoxin-like negative regulator of GroEL